MIDLSRDKRQDEIIDKFAISKGIGYLIAYMGFGKTITGLKAHIRIKKRYTNAITHVVVPTDLLYNQWLEKIKEKNLTNIKVFIINTYVKNPKECTLLIIDECHVYSNQEAKVFSKVFEIANYKFILGLTGTLEQDRADFLHSKGIYKIDEVTEEECRKNKWIADVREFNLLIDLLPDERKEYDKWNRLYWDSITFFGVNEWDMPLVASCINLGKKTDKTGKKTGDDYTFEWSEKLGWNKDLNHKYSPKNIKVMAVYWSLGLQNRKNILYNSHSKLLVTIEILRKFNFKTIVFSESTIFANSLAKALPDIGLPYHSYLPSQTIEYQKVTKYKTKPDKIEIKTKKLGLPTIKKQILEKLYNNEIRALFTAKALDLGADIKGMQMGIIASGNSTRSQGKQRKERSGRKEGDKISYVINIICRDSVDERWVKKRQKGSKNYIQQITNINEIII